MTAKCLPVIPLTMLVLLIPGLLAADEGEKRDLRRELKSADEDIRISAIQELAEGDEKHRTTLIAGRLRDSSPRVRAAAIDALGRIGGRVAVSRLVRALKSFDDDSESVAAVCAALGQTGSAAAVGPLANLALKEMSRDAVLTKAAVSALGKIKDRKSIEQLIGLMGSATPVSTSRTYSYGHPEIVPSIRLALQGLTGLKLYEHTEWAAWWRRVRKGYRFPEDPSTLLSRQIYRDEGFLIELTRPEGDRWEFSRPRGLVIQAGLRRAGAQTSYAVVQVRASSVRSSSQSSPDGLADYLEDRFENEFKNIKAMERQDRGRIARRQAVYHRVVGMLNNGRVIEMRQWVVLHEGNLYTIRAMTSSGASEQVESELSRILKSIRFLPA